MKTLVDAHISTAFQPGDNPENLLQHGNVLERLEPLHIQGFLGESATRGGAEAPIYEQMLRERGLVADQNLLEVLAEQNVEPAETLMVSFTGDGIGFYDELKKNDKITSHQSGWEMIAGYNAMFARASERKALGGRAADCSVVKGWASLPDGDTVMLLLHLTRDNIEGDGALSYGDNQNQSYIQAALEAGSKYYGIDVEDFHLEQMAKIDTLNYKFADGKVKVGGQEKQLTAEQMMDFRFRGWFDQGMLHNVSNPDWKRGDPILPTDQWVADYQQMTEHVIRNSGALSDNINVANAINPGDIQSGHASNAAANDPARATYGKRPDARDAYLVIARTSD